MEKNKKMCKDGEKGKPRRTKVKRKKHREHRAGQRRRCDEQERQIKRDGQIYREKYTHTHTRVRTKREKEGLKRRWQQEKRQPNENELAST